MIESVSYKPLHTCSIPTSICVNQILELGVRDAAFQVLKRLASQLKKLEITLCSLEIKRDFFTDLELDLDEFEVNGARELRLEHHSLKFDYLQHPIRIKFSAIGNPMSIHHDTFGVNVRCLLASLKVSCNDYTTMVSGASSWKRSSSTSSPQILSLVSIRLPTF